MSRRVRTPDAPFVSVDLDPEAERRVKIHPENIVRYVRDEATQYAKRETKRLEKRINDGARGVVGTILGQPALLAAAGASGALLYAAHRAQKKSVPASRAAGIPTPQAGSRFALQIIVDPKHRAWTASPDIRSASTFIRKGLLMLGWEPIEDAAEPRPRDEAAASALFAGEPSDWIWAATLGVAPNVTTKPPWARELYAYALEGES